MLRSFLALGLIALTSTIAQANPTPNPNTCITSSPTGSSLRVYDQANTSSAVLGGIGVGQCGLFVTNQCEPGWCVIVFSGLNGWVQMQHVSGSDVIPPPGQASNTQVTPATVAGTRRYEITGGVGSVTFGGMRQPTDVDPGGIITFTQLDATTGRIEFP